MWWGTNRHWTHSNISAALNLKVYFLYFIVTSNFANDWISKDEVMLMAAVCLVLVLLDAHLNGFFKRHSSPLALSLLHILFFQVSQQSTRLKRQKHIIQQLSIQLSFLSTPLRVCSLYLLCPGTCVFIPLQLAVSPMLTDSHWKLERNADVFETENQTVAP